MKEAKGSDDKSLPWHRAARTARTERFAIELRASPHQANSRTRIVLALSVEKTWISDQCLAMIIGFTTLMANDG